MDDREDLKQTMIFVTFLLVVGLVTAVCIVELVLYYESKKCNCTVNTQIEELKNSDNRVKEIIKQEGK